MIHYSLHERMFGADPEFPVIEQDEYVIPPALFIAEFGMIAKLNKNKKRQVYTCSAGSIIEDGVAFEFNVTPTNNPAVFKGYINTLLERLQSLIYSVNGTAQVQPFAYAKFDTKKYWEGRDDSFRDCVRFGCDKDFFPKYLKLLGFESTDPQELDVSKHDGRYFGGHLHTQNMTDDEKIYERQSEFAPFVFDFLVGTTNACLYRNDLQRKNELKRLEYYGHPGRGRLQVYSKDGKVNGYEYRPPSNHWTRDLSAISAMFHAGTMASNIIENELAFLFFQDFQDKIPDMWTSLINLDKDKSSKLLFDAIEWSVEHNTATLDEVGEYFNSAEYFLNGRHY